MSWLFKSRKEKKQADQIAKNMVRQISESFESAGKPISPEEYSQIQVFQMPGMSRDAAPAAQGGRGHGDVRQMQASV